MSSREGSITCSVMAHVRLVGVRIFDRKRIGKIWIKQQVLTLRLAEKPLWPSHQIGRSSETGT
ncbi:MAG: hypothetical protein R3F19_18390 [Verrucomicrobiales bacterium]